MTHEPYLKPQLLSENKELVSYPAVPLIEREGSTRKKESLLEGSSYQYSQPSKLLLYYPY